MVRYEAVITALIGAILGTMLGVIFAVLVSRPLADEGFKLSYPVGHPGSAARARGPGRRGGGDRPGAAGLAARRAESIGV